MTEILTGILVIITGVYAYITHRIAVATERSVESAREQVESSLRPYIFVHPFIQPKSVVLYLRIANVGKTTAHDVRLSIDRDFFQWGEKSSPEKNIANMRAFNDKIESIPPNSELVFALAQGFAIFGKGADEAVAPQVFSITAKYAFSGKKVEEKTTVDLRPYLHTNPQPDPAIDELERIRKAIDGLNNSLKSVNTTLQRLKKDDA